MEFTTAVATLISDIYFTKTSTIPTTLFLESVPTSVAVAMFFKIYGLVVFWHSKRDLKSNMTVFRSAGGGRISARLGAFAVSVGAGAVAIGFPLLALWYTLLQMPPSNLVEATAHISIILAMSYHLHRAAITNSGLHRIWTLVMSTLYPSTCRPILTTDQ